MKRAIVTGGTRGIGLAICQRLRAEGFAVTAASRHPARVDDIDTARLDVTDAAAVQNFFAGLDRLDLLVNNAGLAGANAPGDIALWHAIIATNLTGTYLCCAAALERLPDGGRIVNIASVLGLRAVPDQSAYVAAKHGVVGLTKALALAAAARGITVNAICPGWVDSAMATQRFGELGITRAEAAAGVPTGRITAPEEVANMVAFLAGPGAGNITGHALVVDGGGEVRA